MYPSVNQLHTTQQLHTACHRLAPRMAAATVTLQALRRREGQDACVPARGHDDRDAEIGSMMMDELRQQDPHHQDVQKDNDTIWPQV